MIKRVNWIVLFQRVRVEWKPVNKKPIEPHFIDEDVKQSSVFRKSCVIKMRWICYMHVKLEWYRGFNYT